MVARDLGVTWSIPRWLQVEFGLNSDHFQLQNIHIPSRQPVLVHNILSAKVVFPLIFNKHFPGAFFGFPLGLCLQERNLPLCSLVSLSRQQLLGPASLVFCINSNWGTQELPPRAGTKNCHSKITTGCFCRAWTCQVFPSKGWKIGIVHKKEIFPNIEYLGKQNTVRKKEEKRNKI